MVEQGKVANLRTKISLQQGEVLSVFVGYHVKSKHAYGPSGTVTRYDVPHLDTARSRSASSEQIMPADTSLFDFFICFLMI